MRGGKGRSWRESFANLRGRRAQARGVGWEFGGDHAGPRGPHWNTQYGIGPGYYRPNWTWGKQEDPRYKRWRQDNKGYWGRKGAGAFDPWIWASMVDPFSGIKDNWAKSRRGATYRKKWGDGAWGRGFASGVDGKRFDDFYGAINGYNESAERKGREKLSKSSALSAFFLGKMWKLASSPIAMGVGAGMAAWTTASWLYGLTWHGKNQREIRQERDQSIYNPSKILDFNVTQTRDAHKWLLEEWQSRNKPGFRPDGTYSWKAHLLDDWWGFLFGRDEHGGVVPDHLKEQAEDPFLRQILWFRDVGSKGATKEQIAEIEAVANRYMQQRGIDPEASAFNPTTPRGISLLPDWVWNRKPGWMFGDTDIVWSEPDKRNKEYRPFAMWIPEEEFQQGGWIEAGSDPNIPRDHLRNLEGVNPTENRMMTRADEFDKTGYNWLQSRFGVDMHPQPLNTQYFDINMRFEMGMDEDEIRATFKQAADVLVEDLSRGMQRSFSSGGDGKVIGGSTGDISLTQ